MKLLALLLAALALAAPAKRGKPVAAKDRAPLWTLAFPGARPTAAYFDVTSGALYVSLRDPNGEGGRIARVSLEGKLEDGSVARSKGPPGPLRSFDGRIYWIAGGSVQSYGAVEGPLAEGTLPAELGQATDIAVGKGRVIYVSTAGGFLLHLVPGAAPSQDLKGDAITGLFLMQDTLHLLRGRRLEAFSLSPSHEPSESGRNVCRAICRGLERTSAGDWLTVSGNEVLTLGARSGARTLLRMPSGTEFGRPAYVYRMDSKEDFFVLPIPTLGEIRAYRVNEGSN